MLHLVSVFPEPTEDNKDIADAIILNESPYIHPTARVHDSHYCTELVPD